MAITEISTGIFKADLCTAFMAPVRISSLMQKTVSGFCEKPARVIASASSALFAWWTSRLILLSIVLVKADNLFLVIRRLLFPNMASTFFFFFFKIVFAAIVAEASSATHTLLQLLISGTLSKNITGIFNSFNFK